MIIESRRKNINIIYIIELPKTLLKDWICRRSDQIRKLKKNRYDNGQTKKNRYDNGQKEKDKSTNNDLHNARDN